MKLFIEQHILTWGAQFAVYDEEGKQQYFVKGEVFTLGRKLHVYNRIGHEVILISQELLSWPAAYHITIHGRDPIAMTREITFFRPKYRIDAADWDIKGNFFGHKYAITRGEKSVATVEKDWGNWVDYYMLEVENPADELLALAAVLTIDCVDDQRD